MASEGSRRLEEALKLMGEAIKLKLGEMEASSGGASPSASAEGTEKPGEVLGGELESASVGVASGSASGEGTDTPGTGLVDAQVESASAAALTLEQRIGNFRKNFYPRWWTDRDSDDIVYEARSFLMGVEDLSGKNEFLTGNLRSMFDFEPLMVRYDECGGGTSLHWAVRMEDLHLVTHILDAHQVDVNAKDVAWEATALHWVVRNGNMDIVKAMCTHPFTLGKFDLSVEDKWGYTALEFAILKSNIPMVKELLQLGNKHLDRGGVIKEVKDEMCKGGSIELLQHYFDSHRETWYTKIGRGLEETTLHWAVRMEDTTLASQILTNGEVGIVNAKERNGSSPLHMAMAFVNLDMVRIMIAEDKVHVNAIDDNGYPPLHLAILSAKLEIVKIIVAKHLKSGNINVNLVHRDTGYTALHCAILNGKHENIEMVRELLKCKGTMRLTEECHSGETPLQIAHDRGFKDIQKSLLECEGVQCYVDELYRDRQVYVDAANAILVGAALIASVTFASWLQPPLGIDSKLGYVDVQHDQGLRAFWIFNCLSFYFAIGTVVFGARSVLPRSLYFIKVTVEKLRKNLLVTAFLLAWSVFFVIIAFGIAGCLVLSPTFSMFQLYMIIPMIIGGLVCIGSLMCLSRSMWEDSSFGRNTTLVKEEEWESKASKLASSAVL